MGNLPSSINNIPQRIVYTLHPQPHSLIITDSQMTTLMSDDEEHLKSLLKNGTFLNARDARGNSLLHMAVVLGREHIFNMLLTLSHMDLNVLNTQKISPLAAAICHGQLDFAKKLVDFGANVNLADNLGYTSLHYAVRRRETKLCEILIRNGSNINSRTKTGQTPLYLACSFGTSDIIHMLLYYSADVTIPNNSGCLPVMLQYVNTKFELRQILYDYTFEDQCYAMELKTLANAMVSRWSRVPEMLNRVYKVIYDERSLRNFCDILIDVDPVYLQLFLNKFGYVVKDMLLNCCILTRYLFALERKKRVTEIFIDVLYTLLESDFALEISHSYCASHSPISGLVYIFYLHNLRVTVLTEVVCSLLSYGATLTSSDLCATYFFYGHCDLFQLMLYMDIESPKEYTLCCRICDHKVIEQSILPHFIYNINFSIETFLKQPNSYLTMDLDILLDYFSVPKLKEFFLDDEDLPVAIRKKIDNLPTVPSLMELARDVTRAYIIKSFGVKNSSQFYTVLQMLPLSNAYKKILSYETKLYC